MTLIGIYDYCINVADQGLQAIEWPHIEHLTEMPHTYLKAAFGIPINLRSEM